MANVKDIVTVENIGGVPTTIEGTFVSIINSPESGGTVVTVEKTNREKILTADDSKSVFAYDVNGVVESETISSAILGLSITDNFTYNANGDVTEIGGA